MLSIPSAAEPILMSFSTAFTKPTFQRVIPLAVGAILTMGRRTVTGILWTMRGLTSGYSSTYHRVFSRAVWSLWPLGKILAGAILRQIPPDEPVLVPMDDTTAQHRGKHVYGKGGQRRVQSASGTGHWYKGGEGLVPIRWVFVHDIQGTHRDEYFYTTDTNLSPSQIVSWFTARWPIETTFQEVRAHLGFETPRQYVANSVLRTAPSLPGLFSIICLIFARDARHHRLRLRRTQWYVKSEPTFSDAMATVRRLFWQKTIFEKSSYHEGFKKLSPKFRNLLLDYLSQAA